MSLEVYDTVAVRRNPSLTGTIQRTNLGNEAITTLDDVLILRHVLVPNEVLLEFVNSGVPPRHYVFVTCVSESKGSFLAHEDDLVLLSRSFDLGDVVRRVHDSPDSRNNQTGIIIDIAESFSIEPVFETDPSTGRVHSILDPTHRRPPSSTPTSFEVTGPELRGAQDVIEADALVYKDWLGFVTEAGMNIILQLDSGDIVALEEPDELFVPISDDNEDSTIVRLPDYDHITRPHVLGNLQGWSVVPCSNPQPGDFIITTKDSLSEARILCQPPRSSLSSAALKKPHGVVLDIVTWPVILRWATYNLLGNHIRQSLTPPSNTLHPYTTLNFHSKADIKFKPELSICDMFAPSKESIQALSTADSAPEIQDARNPSVSQDFRVGDRVKFRDLAAAQGKYSGMPVFSHDPMHSMGDWDLNIYRILGKRQIVTVRWQDGTLTRAPSNDHRRFAGFESDLMPGDLVLHRSGLRQRLAPNAENTAEVTEMPFNEMSFFERLHDLIATKVGVIQAVDQQERVASIRWYENPRIVLGNGGLLLDSFSTFGKISDIVEECSLYEVLGSFPGLNRHVRDLCMLPSPGSLVNLHRAIQAHARTQNRPFPERDGQPLLDEAALYTRYVYVRLRAEEGKLQLPDIPKGAWFGQIVAVAPDGSLTVRLQVKGSCIDIACSMDQLLAVFSLDEFIAGGYGEEGDEDDVDLMDYDEDSRTPSPISRSIEYEGGERIDEDSGDENWESAEEELGDAEVADNILDEEDMLRNVSQDPSRALYELIDKMRGVSQKPPKANDESSDSKTAIPGIQVSDEEPPSFDILDTEPPQDQFGVRQTSTSQSSFLKRIRQEHKSLAAALPEAQIYVRTYESRLDLMRCLIIGPEDTPYEHAPFLIDLYLGSEFPDKPPTAHFHSWTSGMGRVNPNLYEEGKICLSLLGTWSGKEASESWSKDATILQLLVSLQGLVMVSAPFFNEAGFNGYEEEGTYKNESAQYSEKAYVMSRAFIKHALTQPPAGIEDILGWKFLRKDPRPPLLDVLERGQQLVQRSQEIRDSKNEEEKDKTVDGKGDSSDETKNFLRPLSKGASVMLQRILAELKGTLDAATAAPARS